jgi:hypothetical protein
VIGKQPEERRRKSGRTTFYLLTSRPNGRPLSGGDIARYVLQMIYEDGYCECP